jgi:hypothetical protein
MPSVYNRRIYLFPVIVFGMESLIICIINKLFFVHILVIDCEDLDRHDRLIRLISLYEQKLYYRFDNVSVKKVKLSL